jgi:proprotein convertase subtilisin/kexin type 5
MFCVKTCPESTYANSDDGKCKKCPKGCAECSSITSSLKCSSCTDGFFLSSKKRCKKCSKNCLTCKDKKDNCLSCKKDLKLDLAEGLCYDGCPIAKPFVY